MHIQNVLLNDLDIRFSKDRSTLYLFLSERTVLIFKYSEEFDLYVFVVVQDAYNFITSARLKPDKKVSHCSIHWLLTADSLIQTTYKLAISVSSSCNTESNKEIYDSTQELLEAITDDPRCSHIHYVSLLSSIARLSEGIFVLNSSTFSSLCVNVISPVELVFAEKSPI